MRRAPWWALASALSQVQSSADSSSAVALIMESARPRSRLALISAAKMATAVLTRWTAPNASSNRAAANLAAEGLALLSWIRTSESVIAEISGAWLSEARALTTLAWLRSEPFFSAITADESRRTIANCVDPGFATWRDRFVPSLH